MWFRRNKNPLTKEWFMERLPNEVGTFTASQQFYRFFNELAKTVPDNRFNEFIKHSKRSEALAIGKLIATLVRTHYDYAAPKIVQTLEALKNNIEDMDMEVVDKTIAHLQCEQSLLDSIISLHDKLSTCIIENKEITYEANKE